MSSKGQAFVAADHGRIENKGQQFLQITTNEGRRGMTRYQIGDVNRPLMAVSQTCDAGNHVLFTSDGGWVYNLADGGSTRFERHNNVYELGMWLTSNDANGKPPETSGSSDDIAHSAYQAFKDVMRQSGFTRPEM